MPISNNLSECCFLDHVLCVVAFLAVVLINLAVINIIKKSYMTF